MLFHRHELHIFSHFRSRNAKTRRNLEWERSQSRNHPQNGCKRTKPQSNAWNHETSISSPRNSKRVTGAKRRDPDTRAIQAAAIRGTRVILVPTNLFASTFPSSMTFPVRMTRRCIASLALNSVAWHLVVPPVYDHGSITQALVTPGNRVFLWLSSKR